MSSLQSDPEAGGGGGLSFDPPEPSTKDRRSVTPDTKRKLVIGAVATVLLTAVVVAIAVPVSKRNNKSRSGGASAPSSFGDNPNEGNTNNPTTGSFNAHLQSFGSYVMNPYESCSSLRADVEIALQAMADNVIEDNLDTPCNWWGPAWGQDDSEPELLAFADGNDGEVAESAMMESSTAGSKNPAGAAASGGGESSYETNNQVEGVDEADVVKSDGRFVFAAYGSELVMLDIEGNVLDRLTVPDPPSDDDGDEEDLDEEDDEDLDEEYAEVVPVETVVIGDGDEDAADGDGDGTATVGMVSSSIGIGIIGGSRTKPKRTIKSLLLDTSSNTITAITHYEVWGGRRGGIGIYGGASGASNIISGGTTTAYMYNFDTEELVANGSIDITGRFASARSIGSKTHVISNAYLNTYGFTGPLWRCTTEYQGLSNEEYRTKAFNKAKESVREYADGIMQGLGIDETTSQCANIVQISSMSDDGDDTDGSTEAKTERRLDLTNGSGVLNSFVQVTSFDVSKGSMAALSDNVGVAGAFVPTSNAETYANEDYIVLAGRGYRRLGSAQDYYSWEEYTFLMCFKMDDAEPRVTQHAVGEVRGYLLNQFSMDYHQGMFRIATTNGAKWAPVMNDSTGMRRWERVSESSSQVTKLQFVNGRMERVGQLTNLGVTERIFACRFMGSRAYVVTFMLKDPLYVIDMLPPNPEVLGELNVTGFSSYIHPIGDDQTQLLTVGQEADPETGRSVGMKIALFDVKDPRNPQEVQKYVLNEGNGYSSSAAQWDHHAFRYLDQSKKLILPVSLYQWRSKNNFDGFVVYDVDYTQGIEPVGNVTHANSDTINFGTDWFCFGQASLPSRSMVFNGNLMSFKGHSIKLSQGLDALAVGWEVDLDKDRERDVDQCYDYFGPWF